MAGSDFPEIPVIVATAALLKTMLRRSRGAQQFLSVVAASEAVGDERLRWSEKGQWMD